MIDLRYEMNAILDEFADTALLLRLDSARTCECVDTLSLSARPDCKKCLGTGKIARAEKMRIRSKQSSSQDTLPKVMTEETIGSVAVGVREFYLPYTNRIKQNDYIIFCEWNGNIPLFNEYTTTFRILNVDPLKGDGGRLEYLKATSNSNPINALIRFNSITHNIQGSQYYLAIRED